MTGTGWQASYLGQLRALVGRRLLKVPGARIVLENQAGQVLLQRRTDFALWGLPGGVPEAGESIEQTIRRETLEETGLLLGAVLPIGYASDPAFEVITFPNGDVCHFHSVLFYATEYTGSLRNLEEEAHELRWCEPLTTLPMLPNMARSLEAFERYKETREFQMF